jgi:hypothetical protein
MQRIFFQEFKNFSEDERGGIYWFWGTNNNNPHKNPSAYLVIFPAFFGVARTEILRGPNPRLGILSYTTTPGSNDSIVP